MTKTLDPIIPDEPMPNAIPSATATISGERLQEILDGLDGVTPGPWKYEGSIYEHMGAGLRSIPDDRGFAQLWRSQHVALDARHIARCDPDTIRVIVTELLALRRPASKVVEHGEQVSVSEGEVREFIDAVRIVEADGWVILRPEQGPSLNPTEPEASKVVEPVTVKALEWEDWWSARASISGTTRRRIMERALTPFNAYFIEQSQDDETWWLLNRLLGDEIGRPFEHDWQARAAAQADFNTRILSSLASPPQLWSQDHES